MIRRVTTIVVAIRMLINCFSYIAYSTFASFVTSDKSFNAAIAAA